MTAPRDVRPGMTGLFTRRTVGRQLLLRPDEDRTTQQLYWYVTAVVAGELGIEVHAVQVLSNHIHEVLTDTRGEMPRFMQERNRLLANALKCHRNWPEEVFARGAGNWVELPNAAAIASKIAYTITNCVSAFLVRRPEDWPGVNVNVNDIGQRVIRVKRPNFYFDSKNPRWPPVAELRITMPQALLQQYGDQQAARAVLQDVLEAKVKEAHAEARRQRRGFAGVRRVLRAAFTARPSSDEPFGERTPTFASAGAREDARRMRRRRWQFLADYRRALQRWREGFHDTWFPFGTWKMRVCYGAQCHPPPDDGARAPPAAA